MENNEKKEQEQNKKALNSKFTEERNDKNEKNAHLHYLSGNWK